MDYQPPNGDNRGAAPRDNISHEEWNEIKQILDKEPPEPQRESGNRPKFDIRRELFDWAQALVSAIVFVVLVFALIVRVIGVDGHSMEMTLLDSEKMLISNLFYTPQQGDIVVFTKKGLHASPEGRVNEQPLVKRVIATEGQTVYIEEDTQSVYVDGELLDEPYINTPTHSGGTQIYPLIVPEGHVFVMGDNRDNSRDSRDVTVGTIDTRYILGRVLLRVFPFNKFGPVLYAD